MGETGATQPPAAALRSVCPALPRGSAGSDPLGFGWKEGEGPVLGCCFQLEPADCCLGEMAEGGEHQVLTWAELTVVVGDYI